MDGIGKTLTIGKSDGLRYRVNLKVGGQFFISTNIDVQDGLFNGATGVIKLIEQIPLEMYPQLSDHERLIRVWMHFADPLIGSERRKQFNQKFPGRAQEVNADQTWTPIDKFTRTLNYKPKDGLRISRTQIPVVACNGMTIAKSQGSSMPSVVVSLKGSRLDRSELYVACSRATSLNGLFIDGIFSAPKPPKGRDTVGEEMQRLRSERKLQFLLEFMQDMSGDFYKIYFHNIQSLGAHLDDLVSDCCPISSDIIALVEPHLLRNDTIHIPGFHVFLRKDCTTTRNQSEGVVLLARGKISIRL